MDLHPITVHFPVALLSVYSVLELIRWNKITGQPYWFYVKALLVIFGSLGAVAGLVTGEMAAEGAWQDSAFGSVLGMHENFAKLTTVIFGFLALLYFVSWVERSGVFRPVAGSITEKLWDVMLKLKRVFIETRFVMLFVLIGLVSVLVTGALGGFMVYGENVDPFVKFVYNALF